MENILSSISYLIPINTVVIFIYFNLLLNFHLFSIGYDFRFKFYLSILLGILTSVYIYLNISFEYVAIFFGCVLTYLIIKGIKTFSSRTLTLDSFRNNLKIIELIYNLKFHSNEITSGYINKLLPLIDSITNKSLRDLINKKINNLKFKNNTSKTTSESIPSQENIVTESDVYVNPVDNQDLSSNSDVVTDSAPVTNNESVENNTESVVSEN